MKPYSEYLQERGYSPATVASYTRELQTFLNWCKRHGADPEEIDYKRCLKYIQYLRGKGTTKKTVNHRLRTVKHYFNYLIDQGCRSDNPIENTHIKGIRRGVNHNLLEADELEDLYYSFETENCLEQYHRYTSKRAKAIIGLLVYQGLTTSDIGNLKIEHLQLQKGRLYVPSTRRSNSRTLELRPWQVMELLEYTREVRPKLQERIHNYSEQLFPINTRFDVITHQIAKKLKRYNQKFDGVKQLRASVITLWLGQYNLRKVQYLAGHRYISSTERYLQDDLENLHEIVNRFHPIS